MSERLSYRLDGDDRIVAVGGGWAAAARVGGAKALLEPGFIGRSLWQYIRARPLRELYQELFAAVRDAGRPVEFPYRCDTPERRRHMRMRLTPLADRGLEVGSWLVQAEPRGRPLVVVSVSRGSEHALRCSVCNRFRVADGWSDVIDAVAVGVVLDSDRPLRVIYGVCQDCRQALRQTIAQVR